jgi:hypothetical protein
MIKDDTGHIKILLFGGIVTLALGLGYSLGLNHQLASAENAMKMATITPETILVLDEAGERARAAGDTKTAEWLKAASASGRERLFAWASARAHGVENPGEPGAPRVHAASR